MGWRVGSGRGWGGPRCDKIFDMNLEETHKFVDSVVQIAELFDQLARGMQHNRRTWEASERATEGQLIDPVLRLLGWDPMNADDVGLQVKCSSGIADYVLRVDEKPIAVLEAKKLGTRIDTDVRWQASGYAEALSAPLLILTDGDRWEIYNSSNRRSKPTGTWTISRRETFRSALEAAKVSKDVMVATFGSNIAPEPPLEQTVTFAHETRSDRTPTGAHEPTITIQASASDWIPLSEVGFQTGDSRPKRVIFADSEYPIDINSYKDLWVEIVEWLFRNETPSDWEQHFFNRFASVNPPNPNSQPHPRRLSNGLWLATNYSTIYTGQNIKNALNRFGRDLQEIKISFSTDRETNRPRSVGKPDTALTKPLYASGSRSSGNDMDWYSVGDPTWSATHTKPKTVKILGNSHRINEWADFSQLICTWLIEIGRLEPDDCPVSITTAKRCLVNTVPAHPDGKPFYGHSRRQLPKDMWIETNQGANQHVQYASRVLRKFGVDPHSVQVQLK